MIIRTMSFSYLKGDYMRSKVKRIYLSLLLAAAMMLSACGREVQEGPATTAATTEAVATAPYDPYDAATEAPVESPYGEPATEAAEGAADPLTYDETVDYGEVYNENGLIIEVTEYVHTPEECSITLEFTNESEDELEIYADAFSLNGRMSRYTDYKKDIDKMDIKPGETATRKLNMNDMFYQIAEQDRNVKNIKLSFFVYNLTTKLAFNPYVDISTSIDDGIVKYIKYPKVYEDNEIIIEYSLKEDDYIYFNLYNKSKEAKKFTLDYIGINLKKGYSPNDFYSDCYQEIVFPNCKGEIYIELSGSFTKNYSFNDLEEITLSLNVDRINPEDEEYTIDNIHIDLSELD